ncbi:Deoxyribodipyrimidine photo-lyase [Thioalkalivibrio sulfidiphilus HL-EbGr7]|uniref:Deoxyribodipyrimidine photo-lyase n=1 Tax=Thioalkalivibrio sulfidiphilus (strain HL-EbGR7) TaxID=396588 RepID=B8GR59_THISH|nr:deoxyribodipyrimidine photo-lyase [Thioalkalivibrio sulfidiphilus]ACL72479.1 Deoxyribodipyrimidine photo-lyase [Thioalkalivibrio sulfidiphilus HL-EbGr7]
MKTLLWFRRDLRLTDNPALARALEDGEVIPVYIHAPEEEGDWAPGGASLWWLHHSLAALGEDLRARGVDLVIRQGASLETLQALIRETGAQQVLWNRLYEPALIARDTGIKQQLRDQGIRTQSFNAALLFEPWTVAKQDGTPYKVFTPFWKACLGLGVPVDVTPAPERIQGPAQLPPGETLKSLGLLPDIDWAAGFTELWQPGEAGALARLAEFMDEAVADYDEMRNRPDRDGSSRLSPYLHFGEIGPRQAAAACQVAKDRHGGKAAHQGIDSFLREIGWREFAHHLLYHFPRTSDEPLDPRFRKLPWRELDEETLRAWQRGRTGIPLVDAAMRALWATGWMHNRVRMIVASLLTKNLGAHWLTGARWFWDTLVDADLAGNTLGWQWTAGCGADAAPYFRVFNPVLQGERFDPNGDYLRQWVPELAKLPAKYIHRPWEAPEAILKAAGVRLGGNYPRPIVDLAESRRQALEMWEVIKGTKDEG